jgi:hypothetical protein
MSKLYTFLTVFFGFSSFVFSQETVNLVPLVPSGHIVYGREYIPLANDHIRVELAYDGTSEEGLVFDLLVFNQTGDTVSVDPQIFYYLSLDDPDADSSRFAPRMATTPTWQYKWYDRALEKTEFREFPNPVLDLVEAGVEFIAAASVFFSAFDPDIAVETASYLEDLGLDARGNEILQEGMMNAEELEPGEQCNGFVCFPGHGETSYLMFCFPIEEQEFQFVYQRVKPSGSH